VEKSETPPHLEWLRVRACVSTGHGQLNQPYFPRERCAV
jgi:hypothetical protein